MTAAKALYAMLVNATAGQDCQYPAGAEREVMVVAQGDGEAAHERALWVLHRHGWIAAEVKRQAPMAGVVPQEPGYLRNAVLGAMEHGAQIIVYDR